MPMETLREYRKRMGLTLADLADKIGVTPGQLSRIETGESGTTLAVAVKIETETGIKPADIASIPRAENRDAAA